MKSVATVLIITSLAFVATPVSTIAYGGQTNVSKSKTQTSTVADTEWSFDRSLVPPVVATEEEKAVLVEKYDNEETPATRFQVKGKKIVERERVGSQNGVEHEIWDLFVAIAGTNFVKKTMKGYGVYDDPATDILGFVYPKGKVNSFRWHLWVNSAGSELSDPQWLRSEIIVLIHEYAHILTLEKSQVWYLTSDSKCEKKGGHPLGGANRRCARPESYLDEFATRFWIDVKGPRGFDFEREAFFRKHANDYVTKYAATSVDEDIAESFVDFVLQKKPLGTTLKEKKMLFFYEYPELVKLRSEIRLNVQKYFI